MTAHMPGLPLPVSAVEKPLGASPAFSWLKSMAVVCAERAVADRKKTNRVEEQILNFICLPPFFRSMKTPRILQKTSTMATRFATFYVHRNVIAGLNGHHVGILGESHCICDSKLEAITKHGHHFADRATADNHFEICVQGRS